MKELENAANLEDNYKLMVATVKEFLSTEDSLQANLANITALINHYMPNINWVGFYVNIDLELVLNTFQGKVACTRIPFGKGVCGKCAETGETVVVENVHNFEGHIACDSESMSEIVAPIFIGDTIFGVLDIDSPTEGRFTDLEKEYVDEIAELISDFVDKKFNN